MESIKQLEAYALQRLKERYPRTPVAYLPKPKYNDRTANGLTKAIIDYIRLIGGQAERISVTGRFIDQSKVITDCIGRKRRIGNGKWIKPSMQVGTADISATYQGRSIKVEVKVGKDKQSPEQANYQRQVEQAGGIYILATDFRSFIEQWREM